MLGTHANNIFRNIYTLKAMVIKMIQHNKSLSWMLAAISVALYIVFVSTTHNWDSIFGIFYLILILLIIANALLMQFSKNVQNFYINKFGKDYRWVVDLIIILELPLTMSNFRDILSSTISTIGFVLIVTAYVLMLKRARNKSK